MHVREVYEFYKLSEGYRYLFWTCEPTNLSHPFCSHLFWQGDGPFRQAMFEAWHGAGLGQLHRQMDSVLSGAPQPNLSRKTAIKKQEKKGEHCSWDMGIRSFWWFLAWIDNWHRLSLCQAHGVPIWGMTVQNEPLNNASWEACRLTPCSLGWSKGSWKDNIHDIPVKSTKIMWMIVNVF